MVKERPILFNGEMVRAVLDGRKTQTRRVMKPQPEPMPSDLPRSKHDSGWWWSCSRVQSMVDAIREAPQFSPYGYGKREGWTKDRLYCRETWATELRYEHVKPSDLPRDAKIWYAADGRDKAPDQGRWRPSIHIPRWMSRITLEVLDVRVERVQEISEADAKSEGTRSDMEEIEEHDWSLCPKCGGTLLYDDCGPCFGVVFDNDCHECDTYKKRFMHLWNSINAKRGFGWDVNPWVWVVETEVVR